MKVLIATLLMCATISIKAQSQFSLMSYNIRYDNPGDGENWWENRKQDVSSLVRRYHPDFLGIQEGLDHQVSYLNEELPEYKFVGIGRDGAGQVSEFTAIFYDTTKFKLVASKTFWLSETPEQVSRGWDAALNRISTYATFEEKSTGSVLHLFNAHFDHMGAESRKNSAQLILQQINHWDLKNAPVIVMGDFNSVPESEPIRILNGGLSDTRTALAKRASGPEGTFNGFDTKAELNNRIDYIFSNNLKVINQRHIDDLRPNLLWPSDHLPIYAIVEFE